jgi:hypothetical protein
MTIEEVLAIEDPTRFAIALGYLVYGPPEGSFDPPSASAGASTASRTR